MHLAAAQDDRAAIEILARYRLNNLIHRPLNRPMILNASAISQITIQFVNCDIDSQAGKNRGYQKIHISTGAGVYSQITVMR